jgi:hypothetical protein
MKSASRRRLEERERNQGFRSAQGQNLGEYGAIPGPEIDADNAAYRGLSNGAQEVELG